MSRRRWPHRNERDMNVASWSTPIFPNTEPLLDDASCGVCIVGAGVAGLSTAYLLLQAGRDVLVLDRDELGVGETARSTAQLVTAIDRGWRAIVQTHGVERARLAAESHARAIERTAALIHDEHIDCDFERVSGFLLAGRHPERLEQEFDAARTVGIHGLAEVAAAPIGEGPAIVFPDQAQLDPVAYLAGLAHAVFRLGGRIYCHSGVEAISGSAGEFRLDLSTGAAVRARMVVIATNAPIRGDAVLSLKQAPYQTYVVGAEVTPGAVPIGLYWDLEDPFHYVRVQRRRHQRADLLLIGGEDHRAGQSQEPAGAHYERLADWGRQLVPECGPLVASWSGQVIESVDGLGFHGRLEPGMYVITGDSGNGMTHAMAAAMTIADLEIGAPARWCEVYDPHRLRLRAVPHAVREMANTAAQLLAHVTPGDLADATDLAPGTGAIVRRGLNKIAAYRADDGTLHEHSAVCPHMGCVVRWNAADHDWECPCHGSRFDAFGRVEKGPALQGLAPVPQEPEHITGPPSLNDGRRVAGVIFDVDGTLVDSNDAHARAWATAFREGDIDVPLEVVRPLIGMGGDSILPRLIGVTADSAFGREIDRRRGQIFRERFLPTLHPFPLVRALMERLKALGQRLIVASSAAGNELEDLLIRAQVADLIDARVSGDDAENAKPAADIVQVAIGKSGISPTELLFVGDTPYDVEAGTRAGVAVIAVQSGGWSAPQLSGAVAVFADAAELLSAIEGGPMREIFHVASASRRAEHTREPAWQPPLL